MKKLIITAALVGGGVTPTHGPYNPITPDEIAKEAQRVENAGAATVHIHPRNPETGEVTADPVVFKEILSRRRGRLYNKYGTPSYRFIKTGKEFPIAEFCNTRLP